MPCEVDKFDPSHAMPGERISIEGAGFVRPTTVMFWGDAAGIAVQVEDDSELTVTVPEGAKTGIVTAKNINGEGRSSVSFTVDDPGPVRVQRFEPIHGQTGEQIKIFGKGFTNGRSVKFGPYQATQIRWMSDAILIASVPLNAPKNSRLKIEVTTADGSGKSPTDFLVD
ncbi:IPT/TIG domain-containing protein [Dyella sp. Tek66A03]|uniref:IPT/TIG domain-containing protein n=1 Tax=Dyella sp. Tek66A03 TaxID=3458298 RepID=UPI00403EA1F8